MMIPSRMFLLFGLAMGAVLFGSSESSTESSLAGLESSVDEWFEDYENEGLDTDETRATAFSQVCNGRLTLESAVPISTTDQVDKSTLYFALYYGSKIALYDGSKWTLNTFTQRSLSLSGLTADKNYDVFLYNNGGTLTLELSAAWTNDTTRADALTTQNGVYVKSGATTRRFLGTIRTTGTTTTEDSVLKRFVWNHANRVSRYLKVQEATNTWTYNSSTWRSTNNSAGNRVQFVSGTANNLVYAVAILLGSVVATTPASSATGIGLDSTTATSTQTHGGKSGTIDGEVLNHVGIYRGYPSIGFHYLQWLEHGGGASNNQTFYGDNGDSTHFQSAMIAWIEG